VIRFHLDQHVANAVAVGLRLRGIDVSTTHEAGLQNAEDLAHIVYALAEGRVIFTQDDDFLRHHRAGVHHAGIVYSKQGSRSIGEIVRYLKLMNDCLDAEDMIGQVEYF
jgi:predicted nuclease of predicted toxin-antitoxin system